MYELVFFFLLCSSVMHVVNLSECLKRLSEFPKNKSSKLVHKKSNEYVDIKVFTELVI